MCIPTFFNLEIIDSDDECVRPLPKKACQKASHKSKGKSAMREGIEIDVDEEICLSKKGVSVKDTVRVIPRRHQGQRKQRMSVEEEIQISSQNDSFKSNEAVIVEIAPGKVARLHHRRKRYSLPSGAAERTAVSAAASVADYWLCPGCEGFIKMSIEICVHCGHRKQSPELSSPKCPPQEAAQATVSADSGSGNTAIEVEVDVNAANSSKSVEVEVDVNTFDYEQLKKMMLETGATIAKEVLAEESKRKCPTPDGPIQIQPLPQPLPCYPVVFPPPQPSCSPSTSRSSSNVSRRSFDRMRSQVRHLNTRISRLGSRTGVLSGNMRGLGNFVRGLDCEVQNINQAVYGLDTEVRGINGAVQGLDDNRRYVSGALHHLEGQVQANSRWVSALDQRDRCLARGLGSVRGRVECVEQRINAMERPKWRSSRSWSRGRSRVRWGDHDLCVEWLEGQRERVEGRREWVEGCRERLEDNREQANRWREDVFAPGRGRRWRS